MSGIENDIGIPLKCKSINSLTRLSHIPILTAHYDINVVERDTMIKSVMPHIPENQMSIHYTTTQSPIVQLLPFSTQSVIWLFLRSEPYIRFYCTQFRQNTLVFNLVSTLWLESAFFKQ